MKWRLLYRAWKARLRDQRLEISIARALIRPGELVVDAGANKGAYLYWLAKAVGPRGQVLAYEPQPELARYLMKVLEQLHCRNVQVLEIALSHASGSRTLHVPGGGISPGASLESSVLEHMEGSRFECAADTLDHQLGALGKLSFLKVDVEGHELALFQGAIQTFRRDLPAILFECESRHLTNHTMADVFSFLQELGHEGFLLARNRLLPVSEFEAHLHQNRTGPRYWDRPDYFNNFLFAAPGVARRSLGAYLKKQ